MMSSWGQIPPSARPGAFPLHLATFFNDKAWHWDVVMGDNTTAERGG